MKNLFSKLYDLALLAYSHVDILVNQAIDKVEEKRR